MGAWQQLLVSQLLGWDGEHMVDQMQPRSECACHLVYTTAAVSAGHTVTAAYALHDRNIATCVRAYAQWFHSRVESEQHPAGLLHIFLRMPQLAHSTCMHLAVGSSAKALTRPSMQLRIFTTAVLYVLSTAPSLMPCTAGSCKWHLAVLVLWPAHQPCCCPDLVSSLVVRSMALA